MKNNEIIEDINFLVCKANLFDFLVKLNRDFNQLSETRKKQRAELIAELTDVMNLLVKSNKEIVALRERNAELNLVSMKLMQENTKLKEIEKHIEL